MKAVCPGHQCLRIAGHVQQQLWGVTKGAGFLGGSCAAMPSGLCVAVTVAMILPCTLGTVGCWYSCLQSQSWLIASLPSLWSVQFWHCSFPASHSFHCSVPSGTALALPIFGVVEQIVLLPLGELRYRQWLVLLMGTFLHLLLPELPFSWPWPCLVGLDYPCMWCRTSSSGWVVATGRTHAKVLGFFFFFKLRYFWEENYWACMSHC